MDDVAIELVEAKLFKVLPDIFSPMTVFTMTPELVGRIASESDEKLYRREQLEKELDKLGKNSDFCKRFVGTKFVGKSSGHDYESAQTRDALALLQMGLLTKHGSRSRPVRMRP